MKLKTLEIIHGLLKERDAALEAVWEDESRKLKKLRQAQDRNREDEPEDEAVFNQEKRVRRAWEKLRSCRDALEDFEHREWN